MGVAGDVDRRGGHYDRDNSGTERPRDGHREHEPGERLQHVLAAHDSLVDVVSEKPGQRTDRDPDDSRQKDRRKHHDQVESGGHDDSGQDVFAVLVRAKRVRERGRERGVGQVHAVGVVANDERAQQRRQKDQSHDEEPGEGGRVAAKLVDEIAEPPDNGWHRGHRRARRNDLLDGHLQYCTRGSRAALATSRTR